MWLAYDIDNLHVKFHLKCQPLTMETNTLVLWTYSLVKTLE